MAFGTAKPGPAERARVRHHLIDIIDPDQGYWTGGWRADAISAVVEILDREKIPVLVGGTMLYYRALVGGLDVLPQADPQLRAEIGAEGAKRGWPALHAELAKVDPRSALRIASADSQRIQRALEAWRVPREPLPALP